MKLRLIIKVWLSEDIPYYLNWGEEWIPVEVPWPGAGQQSVAALPSAVPMKTHSLALLLNARLQYQVCAALSLLGGAIVGGIPLGKAPQAGAEGGRGLEAEVTL